MIVIGMISGTSVDAIDVAAARFDWQGDTLVLHPLGHREVAWPEATKRRLLAALPPAPVTMGEVCALDVLVGEAFADAAMMGVRELAGGQADLVSSHGQNVFHWIEGGRARGTLQLGQPAIIAEMTGLPVVSDLRARDVAAGGQGAPLASTLDALWLAGAGGPRAALNLGGIANITVVGAAGETVLAYDTGPASCLLDIAATRLTAGAQRCDEDGRMALAGHVRDDLLTRFLAEPYYALPPPKSTGRELFDTGSAPGRSAAGGRPGPDGHTDRVDSPNGGRRLPSTRGNRGGRVRRRRAQSGADGGAAPGARRGNAGDGGAARPAVRSEGSLLVRAAGLPVVARDSRHGSERNGCAGRAGAGADQPGGGAVAVAGGEGSGGAVGYWMRTGCPPKTHAGRE
jgi:Anhydro-N-acetylmuramic acid kinase